MNKNHQLTFSHHPSCFNAGPFASEDVNCHIGSRADNLAANQWIQMVSLYWLKSMVIAFANYMQYIFRSCIMCVCTYVCMYVCMYVWQSIILIDNNATTCLYTNKSTFLFFRGGKSLPYNDGDGDSLGLY